jgi:Tol biopolymer transport system component
MARVPGQSSDRTIRVIEEPHEILGMPRWNDKGTMLAYSVVSNVGGPAPQQQLRLIDASTGNDTPLTSPHAPQVGMEFPTGWTPDARHLLVTSSLYVPGESAIALVPVDGAPAAERARQRVTSAPGVSLTGAVMSPDARWVAFRVGYFDGQPPRIAVVPGTGGDPTAWTFVTPGLEPADKPGWSDDGATLYFTLGGSEVMNVWGVRFDRDAGRPVGEPFRITNFAGPGTHILSDIRAMEIGIGGGRLVLPIVKPKGGLWMLDLTP